MKEHELVKSTKCFHQHIETVLCICKAKNTIPSWLLRVVMQCWVGRCIQNFTQSYWLALCGNCSCGNRLYVSPPKSKFLLFLTKYLEFKGIHCMCFVFAVSSACTELSQILALKDHFHDSGVCQSNGSSENHLPQQMIHPAALVFYTLISVSDLSIAFGCPFWSCFLPVSVYLTLVFFLTSFELVQQLFNDGVKLKSKSEKPHIKSFPSTNVLEEFIPKVFILSEILVLAALITTLFHMIRF